MRANLETEAGDVPVALASSLTVMLETSEGFSRMNAAMVRSEGEKLSIAEQMWLSTSFFVFMGLPPVNQILLCSG